MTEDRGVHWFWWLFWLFVFWPALIMVWVIHDDKVAAWEAKNKK